MIVGEIVDIQYNDDNAIAKTFCSVAVNEVIKGNDIIENSIISVMELQGYCRLSKFIQVYGDAHFPNYDEEEAETLCFMYSIEGEPLVQIGEKYVFFLSPKLDKDSEDGEELDSIEGNYYITKATFMGRYKLNKEGLYQRYSPYDGYYVEFDNQQRALLEEKPLTLEEIKDTVNGSINRGELQ